MRVKDGLGKNIIFNERKMCAVCGNLNLKECLTLPQLPLTGPFCLKKPTFIYLGIDQEFLWCPRCGHGQLGRQIDPVNLYNLRNYAFRSSASVTAMAGIQYFINFLKTTFPKKKFACAVDVGCNDLYLLKKLKSFVAKRVGIDPIWSSSDRSLQEPGIQVIGKLVEEVDFERELSIKPDLVLCTHTIEHISDPVAMLKKLMAHTSDDACFVFETPSLTALLERGRFDQIFHDHLQYFSPASMEYLITQLGGEVIAFNENYHHWGAMQVAFRKKARPKRKFVFPLSEQDIQRKIKLFQDQMKNAQRVIKEFHGKKYGYGAAMIFPVLAYHLGIDLDSFDGIIDDDPYKVSKFYLNSTIPIMHSSKIKNFSQHMVLISAVDNVVPIMQKMLASRPKQIVYPFHSI